MILLWNSADMTVRFTLDDVDDSRDYVWEANRTLARDMLAHLSEVLAERGATVSQLTGIGVFRGPGSYTGLRIGMTVLNTLAASLDIPIVGATGEDWQALCRARLSGDDNDHVVLPEYGGDAHITKPRK
jgi:tRNA threonylcarbamoyladenosine biosynthesis protein TsaB